jgi:hypothetical protein
VGQAPFALRAATRPRNARSRIWGYCERFVKQVANFRDHFDRLIAELEGGADGRPSSSGTQRPERRGV